jgi:hypothetical protein
MPRRTFNIIAPLLILLLIVSGAAASSQRGKAGANERLNERQLVAYWWNEGSCHGYPDVMQVYAVEYDGNGDVVAWMNAGSTSGTDSCSQYHESAYVQAAYDWCQCPNGVSGPVLGNPSGSTTEHP